jgi:hypothetical protein
VITYTDSSTTTSYSISYISSDGDDGTNAPYYQYRYAKNGSNLVSPSFTATDLAPSGWLTSIPSLSPLEYAWKIVAKLAADGNSLEENWALVGIDSKYSGSSVGPALNNQGTYDSGTSYTGNSSTVSAVLYNSIFYRARVDAGTFSGQTPTNTAYWNTFGVSADSVATNLFLATLAYIDNLGVNYLRTGTSAPYILIDGANNVFKLEQSGSRFLRMNESSDRLMYIRADGGTGIHIYTQDTSGVGIKITAQTGGKTIETYGNLEMTARSGETISLSGNVAIPQLAIQSSDVSTPINSSSRVTLSSSHHWFILSAKTANRQYSLPDPSAYNFGEEIEISNYNDFDSDIYPLYGDYINASTGNVYIRMTDSHQSVRLRSNGYNRWTICGGNPSDFIE